MTFNNPLFFLVFLPLCIAGFQATGRLGRKPAVTFLAVASLAFYAMWSAKYLLLLIGSTLFNYGVALRIKQSGRNERAQTIWLIFGVAADLALLCYYKYLFPSLNAVLNFRGLHHHWASVVLPLGISFFTFTQIAYLVDLKQGIATSESPASYFLFVTFFPHLVAGPILHHKEMMPQFAQEGRYGLNAADVSLGLTWFSMGLFKKAVVADQIAPIAERFYSNPLLSSTGDSWVGVLTYALQLYFDFSGYSDMAMGLARMFSIRFPLNFNSPYKSESIIDYWQRWHITLTLYIMAYVYTPILLRIRRKRQEKGKKVSRQAVSTWEGFFSMIAVPTMITLGLAGVWHGAGIQFVLYGLVHGSYITVNHAWRTFVAPENVFRRLLRGPFAVAVTFFFVVLAQVMFRAEGLRGALSVYGALLGRNPGHGTNLTHLALVSVLLAVVWLMPNTQEILGEQQRDQVKSWSLIRTGAWQPNLLWWAATAVTFVLAMSYASASSTFLYFQF